MRILPALGLVFVMAALVPAPAAAQAEDVPRLAAKIDHHYNGLKSLEADFTEIYHGPGVSRTEAGALWLKKPRLMRWEYRQPREKLFVTDGKTAWFYVPADHQARRAPLKKLNDLRSPLLFLLGGTRLEKELAGLSLAPDVPAAPGTIVLRGIPRNLPGQLRQVLLGVTPEGRIQSIVAEQVDGSSTEFLFSNQKDDLPIPDQRFRFVPPPGVEIIDADDLGQ